MMANNPDPTFEDLNAWRRQRVLIVDDDTAVRELLFKLLTREGFAVEVAGSAEEAMEVARDWPEIDLLITDIVMRKMNGIELAAELCRSRPKMRVLYTSSYTPRQLGPNQKVPDDANFIEKPWTTREIVAKALELIGPKHPNIAD